MTEGNKKAPPMAILWLRSDLRLDDNPALHAAVAEGGPVLPVFIWEPEAEGDWQLGGASRSWLHRSLENLDTTLRAAGSRLIIRQGNSLSTLLQLIDETGSSAVFWNRRYEPAIISRDKEIKAVLRSKGVTVASFNSLLLFEPWAVQTKSSTPYKVFTPFYRACLALPEPDAPLTAPKKIRPPAKWPLSRKLGEIGLLPRIPWDAGIRKKWKCGEAECSTRFDGFLKNAVSSYLDARDRPDFDGTSRLSPYLHFGEVSPRRLWHLVREAIRENTGTTFRKGAEGYLRQLVWREFAHHLLFHFPSSDKAPLNLSFEGFPWKDNPKGLRAWQRGKTGYPIVDAGMRQLWTTGWMHNRVRMLVGSFLVKEIGRAHV